MSSKFAPNPEIFRLQEAAFIEHYDWLLRWALQFTRDRERAEDLVQEVFAQFAFAHTDLSAVRNLPAYLYTTLRNTHISEARLAMRSHGQFQSIVEYSIADAALAASDPYSLFQTQDQLRRVCHYACLRKQSSRAGSVLILRFFHGYHLSEIAEVLGGTCEAVRQSLRFARNEARLFLDEPHALKFIERIQNGGAPVSGGVCAAEELMAELRRAIFQSRQGECLSGERLNVLYVERLLVTADNATLAHIVSCPHCLDRVNQKLGLPLLSARHPADALGPDNDWRGGPGSPGEPGNTGQPRRRAKYQKEKLDSFLLRCRRRATELFEHHPRELCVSVNGHVLGSQSVNSEVSRLRVDVTITEPLNFVEVLSEERVRLLVMPLPPPPDGEPTQQQRVLLSEGRQLDLTFRHGHPWPMVEVVYQDPNFTSEFSAADPDSLWGFDGSRATVASSVALAPSSDQQSERAGLFKFLSAGLLRRPLCTQPRFISGIISVVLIGALLILRLDFPPAVTAASLLERASAYESAPVAADLALHRVMKLEKRQHSRGGILVTNRIELWRANAGERSARRVYDEQGKLLAGEWAGGEPETNGGSRRLICQRDKPQRIEALERSPRQSIRNLELWQLELSAREYLEIIGTADAARLSEDADVYLISHDGLNADGDQLLRATLTLRKSDLHPIALSLLVTEGAETYEYRLLEVSFERPSLRSINPSTFEPDAELLPKDLNTGGASGKRGGAPPSAANNPVARASAALELEVAYALDRFRTSFGDQISLTKTPAGLLEVKGVVDTEETRNEIQNALSQHRGHPALRIEIALAEEVLERQRQSNRVIVREFGSDNAIAVQAELSRYFSTRANSGANEQVDQTVRDFAARVVSASRRALSHSLELRQLTARFSPTELNDFSPSMRIKWFTLIRSHAEALRQEITILDGELRPIFFPNEERLAEAADTIPNETDLLPAIEQLHKLVAANDQVIRSAFAASSAASGGEAVKELRSALARCEKLAERIQEAAAKSN